MFHPPTRPQGQQQQQQQQRQQQEEVEEVDRTPAPDSTSTSACSTVSSCCSSTSAAPAAPIAQRRRSWLTRSLAHRGISFVENQVAEMTTTCTFLRDVPVLPNIAPLRRNEIQLGKLLGRGGFSEVYQVATLDLRSGHTDDECAPEEGIQARGKLRTTPEPRNFVVKHLKKDLLNKRSQFYHAAKDLVLEAKFLARLDHPHILKVRGWASDGIASFSDGQHDGFFLLLDRLDCTLAQKIEEWKSELITNPTIYSVKKVKPMTAIPHLDLKLRYAQQIASAVEYLHERRLIYRDLKPENVGILNDSIQLFDFGLCRELPSEDGEEGGNSDKAYLMSGVGTRRYMAPEVVLHRGYNLKADVFGFSLVLYEMLFHKRPFEIYNRELHEMLVCEDGERPVIPSYSPPNLREVLEKSWDDEPTIRPTMYSLGLRLSKIAASTSSSNGNKKRNKKLGVTPRPPRLLRGWFDSIRPSSRTNGGHIFPKRSSGSFDQTTSSTGNRSFGGSQNIVPAMV